MLLALLLIPCVHKSKSTSSTTKPASNGKKRQMKEQSYGIPSKMLLLRGRRQNMYPGSIMYSEQALFDMIGARDDIIELF
mmetsp:Transcript_19608/g.48246  ORF Transcript_19608/g.48246 Transcript_19608/m.48246 type:complete len:80 (-) Transcript_19608:168-407(-)